MSTYLLDVANVINMNIYLDTTQQVIWKEMGKPLWINITRVLPRLEPKGKGVNDQKRKTLKTEISNTIVLKS